MIRIAAGDTVEIFVSGRRRVGYVERAVERGTLKAGLFEGIAGTPTNRACLVSVDGQRIVDFESELTRIAQSSTGLSESNRLAVAGIADLVEYLDTAPESSMLLESSGKTWRVKVGHVDRVNENQRIYPREVFEEEIRRWKIGEGRVPMSRGGLRGCVEHSCEPMKDACILWRDLEIEQDGGVHGTFEVVADHTLGVNLLAQIEAGMAIGFSIAGKGSARSLTTDDVPRYRLNPDAVAGVVVIQPDFELRRIDSVGDPSVFDAVLASAA